MNDVIKSICNRRSVRKFSAEAISGEKLLAVIKAGIAAPYAGSQLCHVALLRDRRLIGDINGMAKAAAVHMGMAQLKALGENPEYDCTYGAPVLVFICGKESAMGVELDCAAATENMLIAAESLGLSSCWIHFPLFSYYGPDGPKLNSIIQAPEGYKAYACFALGMNGGYVPGEKQQGTFQIIG